MSDKRRPAPPPGWSYCVSGHMVEARGHICPICGATVWPDNTISVTGKNADEVFQVAKGLVEERERRMAEQRAARKSIQSPWVSGSFYLCCAVVVIVLLAVIGNTLPLLVLPIVLVASVVVISVIGAFQQRQDDRLSERGFLQLMLATLKSLPLIIMRRGSSHTAQADSSDSTSPPPL
jgi:hypothetical protein